jgi:hypothetical protein
MVSRAALVAVALQYLVLPGVVQVGAFSLGQVPSHSQQQHHQHQRNSRPTLLQRCNAGLEYLTWVAQPAICLRASKQDEVEGFVEAEDLPAIQALFTKYCDKDGLMTKSALEGVPMISDMLVGIIIFFVGNFCHGFPSAKAHWMEWGCSDSRLDVFFVSHFGCFSRAE